MRHVMHLLPIPYEKIRSGQKTIELRLNDEKRRLIRVGDEIEFVNTDDEDRKIVALVVNIYRFDSFDDLYKSLPLIECGYTQAQIDTAKASDMDVYYSKEKQKKYGVLGIEIKVALIL